MTLADNPLLVLRDAWGSQDLAEQLRLLPPEQLLRLLDEAASQDIAANRNGNTEEAYAEDWKVWVKYTAALGFPPLTLSSGLLYGFVTTLADTEYKPGVKYALTTVSRRLNGVIIMLRRNGFAIPVTGGVAAQAREKLQEIDGNLRLADEKRGRGKATPIQLAHIQTICSRVGTDLYALRDKAILLIGYSIAARRSELAHLLLTDIVTDPDQRGLLLTIRATKGNKSRTVPVRHGANPLTCPVTAYRDWVRAAGITDGPAFRKITGTVNQKATAGHMSTELPGEIVKRLGRLVGIDLYLTGHSLRGGLVTAGFEQRRTAVELCAIGGWSETSGTVYTYNQPIEIWNNPALDVGL